MNNEIIWGIRNAVERGYKLEDAVKSYINAGYSEIEVKEAVQFLTSGSGSLMANPQAPTAPVSASSPAPAQDKKEVKPVFPVLNKTAIAQSNIIAEQKQFAPIMPSASSSLSPYSSNSALPVQQQVYVPPVTKEVPQVQQGKKKTAVIVLGVILLILALMLAGLFIFSKQILEYLAGV